MRTVLACQLSGTCYAICRFRLHSVECKNVSAALQKSVAII